MNFKIQLITQCETGEEIQELAYLERETEGIGEFGITLDEAKTLLATLQKQVVEQQIAVYLAVRQRCPQCAQPFRNKDQHPLVFRTLFGNLAFPSPRWFQCACQPHETSTFSPLANLLPEHCSPERLYLETKGHRWFLLTLPHRCSKTYCPPTLNFEPPVYAIICSALPSGPRLDLG